MFWSCESDPILAEILFPYWINFLKFASFIVVAAHLEVFEWVSRELLFNKFFSKNWNFVSFQTWLNLSWFCGLCFVFFLFQVETFYSLHKCSSKRRCKLPWQARGFLSKENRNCFPSCTWSSWQGSGCCLNDMTPIELIRPALLIRRCCSTLRKHAVSSVV